MTIVDTDGSTTTYGERPSPRARPIRPCSAEIDDRDDRAWSAVLSEGSIGLGRGYIEGWWTSDDPTSVVQAIIRNLHSLDDLRNRLHLTTGGVGDRLRRARSRPTRERNRDDISSHYDLGNDFLLALPRRDDDLLARHVRRPNGGADTVAKRQAGACGGGALARASRHKYDRLTAKLGLDTSTSTLEIGTGWGGFAIQAASQTGAQITTTTVSERQRTEAVSRVVPPA